MVMRLGGAALTCLVAVPAAMAQNISNEVWIGQTGGTNTVTITQAGRTNLAGADNIDRRLNQDGDLNKLSIDQYGWSNQAGAAPLAVQPRGINQTGDRNEIEIRQHTGRDAQDGTNIIGAVWQESPYLLSRAANELTIVQTEESVIGETVIDAAAGHSIGTVTQIFGNPAARANIASITQRGGGYGVGNMLDVVLQDGAENSLLIIQSGQSNRVHDSRQIGIGNDSEIEQGGGEGNLLEYSQQTGTGNTSKIQMAGSRNAVQRILQNNQYKGAAATGNRSKVILDGEGNGGTGNGGTGDFISAAAQNVSAAQANVVQLGDDNDVSVSISGDDNKFGIQQFGEGNGTVVSISGVQGQAALRNESAAFQIGDDNHASHQATGNDNVGAIRQNGERNRIMIEQRGDSNLADMLIRGDDNNAMASTFTGSALSVALSAPSLQPGTVRQVGVQNAATARVDGIGENNFGLHQQGDHNSIDGMIGGLRNELAVVQIGSTNRSISAQTGTGNSLGVLQF
jgi:hypothetical protein